MSAGLEEVEAPEALSIALSPQGHLHVDAPAGSGLAPPFGEIAKHFQRGTGHGLFHLGTAHPETILPAVLGFWRDVGRAFVVRLCAIEDLEALRERVEVVLPSDEMEALTTSAPPMKGGEYLAPAVLEDLCARMADAVRDELAAWTGTVEAFLRQASPAWNPAGRVCFHLAENKNDPDAPFAFLATYTTRLSARAKAQHLPLAQALREYAGARNKSALLALLEPVQRAARTSAVVKGLVDGGALFETLAWTPTEAHHFLTDVPLFEAAGVIVRMPAAWRAKRPPKGHQPRPAVDPASGAVQERGTWHSITEEDVREQIVVVPRSPYEAARGWGPGADRLCPLSGARIVAGLALRQAWDCSDSKKAGAMQSDKFEITRRSQLR